jgi:hypothetical protein
VTEAIATRSPIYIAALQQGISDNVAEFFIVSSLLGLHAILSQRKDAREQKNKGTAHLGAGEGEEDGDAGA